MLMDASPAERYEFLVRVMDGSRPTYHLTQSGQPEKQAQFLRAQPLLYTAHKIQDAQAS